MSRICTKPNKLEKLLKHNLKPSRYAHSIGVEKMAILLARVHDCNEKKAAFAGRYHDIAKCYTEEESNRLVREYGLPMEYYGRPQLAHSKLAERILAKDFGVKDKKVLLAVSSHTTGRKDMSKLEEIIYVADAIEENRDYEGIDDLRDQALTDLDEACLFIMDYTIDRLRNSGMPIDTDTLEAREFINNRINKNNKKNKSNKK